MKLSRVAPQAQPCHTDDNMHCEGNITVCECEENTSKGKCKEELQKNLPSLSGPVCSHINAVRKHPI